MNPILQSFLITLKLFLPAILITIVALTIPNSYQFKSIFCVIAVFGGIVISDNIPIM